MGAKRRQMDSGRPGRVSTEALDRYAVKDPVTFPELKAIQDRSEQQRAREKRRFKEAA